MVDDNKLLASIAALTDVGMFLLPTVNSSMIQSNNIRLYQNSAIPNKESKKLGTKKRC